MKKEMIKKNNFLDKNSAGNNNDDGKDISRGKISFTIGSYKADISDNLAQYLIEPCKCIECCEASPKQGEIMSLSDKLIEYLYRESQRNFRKAKLELATAEQSFEDMKKIVKRKKINFFLVLL